MAVASEPMEMLVGATADEGAAINARRLCVFCRYFCCRMSRHWHAVRLLDLLSGHTAGLTRWQAVGLAWDHLLGLVWP